MNLEVDLYLLPLPPTASFSCADETYLFVHLIHLQARFQTWDTAEAYLAWLSRL